MLNINFEITSSEFIKFKAKLIVLAAVKFYYFKGVNTKK